MGVNTWTLISWEADKKNPSIVVWPKVISFLGYDPSPPPQTPGQRIEGLRRRRGWTYGRLAAELELDSETVTKWARDEWRPRVKTSAFRKLMAWTA